MLTVISPAKRLDWSERSTDVTTPQFAKEANRLAGHARQLSLKKLKGLMGLSDELARLNRDRYKHFTAKPEASDTRPAMFAFAGDTYIGLEAGSMDRDAIERAQTHLRILSGLYGILRPLDAIQPYRLEMGSRLKTRRGKNLYEFWGAEVAKALRSDASEIGTDILVNCASQEYFGAVDQQVLGMKVVTPQFFEVNGDTPRLVSFFAKKARGAMARFIIEKRVTDIAGLRDFDAGGYQFVPSESDDFTVVFHRYEDGRAAA